MYSLSYCVRCIKLERGVRSQTKYFNDLYILINNKMLHGILSSPEKTFKRHKKQLRLTPTIIYAFENLTFWTFQNTLMAEVVIFCGEKNPPQSD